MLLLRGVSTSILVLGADVVGADVDSATAAYADAAVVDSAATADSCESGARRWVWVWARRLV